MSLLRHEKETAYSKLIMNILEKNYNNDLTKYTKAEHDLAEIILLNKKFKKINFINEDINNIKYPYDKYTYINLKDMEASIILTDTPNILLGYNLDYLKVKKYFPYSLQYLLDRAKNKDLNKIDKNDSKKVQEAKRVFNWVKERVLGNNFILNNLSVNKNTGQINYNTTFRDLNYGATLQYITAIIPKDKIVNIDWTGLNKSTYELSKDYNSLFMYFSLFGFTEIYARCTCSDYVRKHGRKHGTANYFCPHLLYSLAQFPYYLMYTFN